MYHIDTHAEINRRRPVDALIAENVDLTIGLMEHYAVPPGSFPDDGQHVLRTDRAQHRSYAIERVLALPSFGELLTAALEEGERYAPGRHWVPATFIVRAPAGQTAGHVDKAHLRHAALSDPEDLSVLEVGLGRAAFNFQGGVDGMASVVLYHAWGEGLAEMGVRSYARSPKLGEDVLLDHSELPAHAVVKDLLQLQRDAAWNMNDEPA